MLQNVVSGRTDIAAKSRGLRANLAARPIMTATSKSKASNGTRLLAGVDSARPRNAPYIRGKARQRASCRASTDDDEEA
jgi:hypothetical protein